MLISPTMSSLLTATRPSRASEAPAREASASTTADRVALSGAAPVREKKSFGSAFRKVALAATLGAAALGAGGCAVVGTYRDPYNPYIVHQRTTVIVPGAAATIDVPVVRVPPVYVAPVPVYGPYWHR